MKVTPRFRVEIDAADRKRLSIGKSLSLDVDGPTELEIVYVDLSPNGGPPSAAPSAAPGQPPKLTTQRGTCPECGAADIALAGHYRRIHPGKAAPWLGPGGVACVDCKRTFPTDRSLGQHRRMMHNRRRTRNKPGPKPKAKSGGTA